MHIATHHNFCIFSLSARFLSFPEFFPVFSSFHQFSPVFTSFHQFSLIFCNFSTFYVPLIIRICTCALEKKGVHEIGKGKCIFQINILFRDFHFQQFSSVFTSFHQFSSVLSVFVSFFANFGEFRRVSASFREFPPVSASFRQFPPVSVSFATQFHALARVLACNELVNLLWKLHPFWKDWAGSLRNYLGDILISKNIHSTLIKRNLHLFQKRGLQLGSCIPLSS